ncbi:MAG: type II toxin-antitoxin system PemK/MazF family toxin, partial [Candidatus Peregrinibacteria bacterium]
SGWILAMMFMKNIYKQGDIILVNFPYTNLIEFKVRPALVMRDQDNEDVILLPISTTINLKPYDILIKEQHYDGEPLFAKSAIRISKITGAESSLIVKKVTRLKPEFFKQVQTALFRYLS